jgi:hypothetical protein
MTATRPLFVVPHTHWDREWYRPFENYRFRLVETLDGLLAADLPYFLLDGQTVVLDDYLAIRPDARSEIATRVRANRLGVGPWYVLVDEFLVSGESLVRNLLEGRRGMAEFGATGAVGYLPDMFGHIGQMPQILRGFGLDTAIVWRGANPGSSRFVWRSPDGSEVTTAWLPLGYYQTMFLVELTEAERLKQVETYAAAFGPDEPVFLLSGADHMAPRADLMAQLDEVKRALPLDARVATLKEALAGPRPSVVLEGELRDASRAYLLPGVLSARTYLKQANVACQTRLERYVEPLTALAWAHGQAYPGAFVRHAWKELMKNHPHDSICGCSIDQVHREMMPRFAAVKQVAEELSARAVAVHPRPRSAPGLYVFNPTGWPVTGWVDGEVHWPLADAPETIHLVDAAGRPVPTVLTRTEDTEVFRAEVDFNPDWFPVRRFVVSAQVALDAVGGLKLKAEPGAAAAVASGVQVGDSWLENDHLRLEVADGRVSLLDKASGTRYADAHYLLDEGDAGDEYNFSPLAGDAPVRLPLVGTAFVLTAPHVARLEVRYEADLPHALSDDRQTRGDRTERLIVRTTFELQADSRVVAVETRFDNVLHDHRLRAVTAFGPGAQPAVWADAAFGVFRREPLAMTALPAAKGTETVMPEFPQGLFSALERDGRGLAVFNQGLSEASLLETPDGWALATTLLRAVGWLSRDDLRTRGGGAGPRFPTPEAQCEGPQAFRYALAPYQGDWTTVQPLAHRYAAPPEVWEADGLPMAGPALVLGDARLVLSAFKKADEAEAIVIRVYNPTPETVHTTLDVKLKHARVLDSALDETRGAYAGSGVIPTEFGPYAIKTWLVELA